VSRGAALVLYARAPRAGRVKTRMLPWLTEREALRLHCALLEDSLHLLRTGAAAAGAVPFLSLSEPWEAQDRAACAAIARAAAGLARLPQTGGDLGERLAVTFRTLIARGFERVVVIGSDSPTLAPAILQEAFAALEKPRDVVLGPAEDGGYYLVGARRFMRDMFEGVPWGTARVLRVTRATLRRRGARVVLLPVWFDVDRPRDLDRLCRHPPVGATGAHAWRRTRAFVESLVLDGRLPLANPRPARAGRGRARP
jgi:uncharacterized protein